MFLCGSLWNSQYRSKGTGERNCCPKVKKAKRGHPTLKLLFCSTSFKKYNNIRLLFWICHLVYPIKNTSSPNWLGLVSPLWPNILICQIDICPSIQLKLMMFSSYFWFSFNFVGIDTTYDACLHLSHFCASSVLCLFFYFVALILPLMPAFICSTALANSQETMLRHKHKTQAPLLRASTNPCIFLSMYLIVKLYSPINSCTLNRVLLCTVPRCSSGLWSHMRVNAPRECSGGTLWSPSLALPIAGGRHCSSYHALSAK